MKAIIFLAAVFVCLQASASKELMAACKGQMDGQEVSLKLYLSTSVYCERTYTGPYNGAMVIDQDNGLFSTMFDMKISYKPGNYSAITVGEDAATITVTFAELNAHSTTEATVTTTDSNTGDATVSTLSCSIPEYEMECL